MTEHRWSGWPGAWCLDCGAPDQREECVADGHPDDCDLITCTNLPCPEPGSRRHDPYKKADEK